MPTSDDNRRSVSGKKERKLWERMNKLYRKYMDVKLRTKKKKPLMNSPTSS